MTLDDRSASSEREREALEFLRRRRKLRGFNPAQVLRVERRLMLGQRPLRRRGRLTRLAVLCLALLAGSAAAAVLDLSRVPLLGSLLPSRKPAGTSESRRARTPTSRPPVAVSDPQQADRLSMPTSTPAPLPPVAAAPEGPPSPPPSSQPTHPLAARSGAARSSTLAPLRLAARTTEPGHRPSGPPDVGGVGTGMTLPPDPRAAAPAARHAPIEPTPAPAPVLRPWTGAPSPQPEDPLLAESRSFSAAVGRWHLDHDAKAALAALDAHQRRFPGGRLSLEATLLRAEILLQSGREREVLVLLDGVSLVGLPRGRELQTVRGELRIKHGRCADGRRDLDDVLARDATDGFGRRAARAISLCPCNDRVRCRH